MRALLDANVLISGLLSRTGAPADLLARWLEGEFELVMTPRLLAELEATLARPKLRRYFDEEEVRGFLELLRSLAEWIDDPDAEPAISSRDPKDDYPDRSGRNCAGHARERRRAPARTEGSIPVLTPRAFLGSLR